MKTIKGVLLLLCALMFPVRAQDLSVAQFRNNQQLQDSIIATIVPDHAIMSKLIGKIAENRERLQMVVQHLTRLLDEQPGDAGSSHAAHQGGNSHTGKESREIKALSGEEVASLLKGEGVGMALAAELNHYPGPRHVLDLAEQLRLSDEQKQMAKKSFDRMHGQAVRLGKIIVEKERILDQAFGTETLTPESLSAMTEEIGRLRGQLRNVHLAAHLTTKELLTKRQIESYDRLRGYSGDQH